MNLYITGRIQWEGVNKTWEDARVARKELEMLIEQQRGVVSMLTSKRLRQAQIRLDESKARLAEMKTLEDALEKLIEVDTSDMVDDDELIARAKDYD